MTEVTYEVWPPLACSRLGNAKIPDPDDEEYKLEWKKLANEGFYDCKTFFLGPETVGRAPPENNKLEDSVPLPDGSTCSKYDKIKKQVARFRIFKFENGKAVEEITASPNVSITWTVTAANSKANW